MVIEIILGVAGAFAYYVLRYDSRGPLGFAEYLRYEVLSLFRGFAGFFLIWGAWSALRRFGFVPFEMPEMTPATALVVGFAAKKAVDYTVGKLSRL